MTIFLKYCENIVDKSIMLEIYLKERTNIVDCEVILWQQWKKKEIALNV